MCNQLTLHHEFRIDTRRTKFEQKTDGILHVCGPYEQRTQRSQQNWLGSTASCMVQAGKSGRNIKIRCMGSTSNLLKRKDESSIRRDRTPSFFTTHSQLFVFRRLSRWKLKIIYEKEHASPRPPPKISLRDNWMKELGSEVAGNTPNQTQPNPNPIVRTGPPITTEQTSRSSAVSICLNVQIKTDADENIDADPMRTGELLNVDNPSVCSHNVRK